MGIKMGTKKQEKVRLDETVIAAAKHCRRMDEAVSRNRNTVLDQTKIVRRDLQEAFEIIETLRTKVPSGNQFDLDRLWKLISR
jgi:transposase-like protein